MEKKVSNSMFMKVMLITCLVDRLKLAEEFANTGGILDSQTLNYFARIALTKTNPGSQLRGNLMDRLKDIPCKVDLVLKDVAKSFNSQPIMPSYEIEDLTKKF